MSKRLSQLVIGKLHLYIGLCCGALFALMGLTGAAIVWLPELDALLNPALLHAAPRYAGAPFQVTPHTVQEVLDRLSADTAYGKPMQLNLPAGEHDVYVASYRRPPAPNAGATAQPVLRQVMLDPYSLQIKGERDWGRFGLSRPLLMPTLFHLHRYFLSGEVGKTVVGIVGVALLLMACSGIVLWWPRPNWAALRRALRIAHGGSWPRFNYTFHKASGFFAAPVLALLAFSGMYFNVPQWVVPLVGMVAQVTPADKSGNTASGAPISAAEAMAVAQALYPGARVSRIGLPAKPDAPYEIRVRQPDEVAGGDGATRITLDSVSGRPLRVRDPLLAAGGDRFLGWQFPLHSGQAFGLGGRVFVSLFGMLPLAFSVTGVLIWYKRRPRK